MRDRRPRRFVTSTASPASPGLRLLGFIAVLAACVESVVGNACADEITGLELSQQCSIVGAKDASAILGDDVQASDPATQTGGICTFPSVSVSHEGIVTYSVVTRADVVARAGYFRLLTRKCGNVDPRSPNYAQCATFHKLSDATTVADYYADRSAAKDATPQAGLGDAAVATATAVYVLRGGEVFECVVRRTEFLDVDRSVALASLLLARVKPLAAPPAPAASKAP